MSLKSERLYHSFTSDEDEVAQLLIAANVDVNSKNNKGATPLIIAAVKGHHSVLRILANNPNTNLHDQVCTTHIYNSIFCVCWKLCNCHVVLKIMKDDISHSNPKAHQAHYW